MVSYVRRPFENLWAVFTVYCLAYNRYASGKLRWPLQQRKQGQCRLHHPSWDCSSIHLLLHRQPPMDGLTALFYYSITCTDFLGAMGVNAPREKALCLWRNHRYNAIVLQTDGQTNRQTDTHLFSGLVIPALAYSLLCYRAGKNCPCLRTIWMIIVWLPIGQFDLSLAFLSIVF